MDSLITISYSHILYTSNIDNFYKIKNKPPLYEAVCISL
nr:MAG TPA: hypothetical protein [Caudoviricetes sp.]